MVKKMKNLWLLFIILLILILTMNGCAYTLRYTITSSQDDGFTPPVETRTFAVENKIRSGKRGLSIETELLEIVTRSLSDLGWKQVDKTDAAYIFNVDFETDQNHSNIRFGFGTFFGARNGFFFSSSISTGENEFAMQYMSITARSQFRGESYSWVAETTTGRVNQRITTLARHIIPTALSHFPEEGFWEIKEKVRLHEKTSN
jgi:hypothetical protein